jgi:hypothetical protein
MSSKLVMLWEARTMPTNRLGRTCEYLPCGMKRTDMRSQYTREIVQRPA